jgi:hypothetical protein
LIIKKKQLSFGGGSCKVKVNNDTGSVVSAVKDAVAAMVPIINALKELPIYYRHHIKKGLELGKIKDQKEEDKKNIKLIKQNLYVTRTLLRGNN